MSLREKQARVTFDESRVSIERMIETVNRLGFRASLKTAESAPQSPPPSSPR